ncbi:MAG: hypothetical protein PHF00_02020 [Elusimicrobia bacterium]|nr:hypothetical protein [Elusimicrobiota bacterium]
MKESAALLYSGGVDSTLAACVLARDFGQVHLNTFTRFGFLATEFPAAHAARLRRRFPATRFEHNLIPAGKFYAEVESHGAGRALLKHGLLVLNSCGHCKVSLHWRNLVFCLQRGIKYAADGAVTGAEDFAEQNPRILMPALREFYGEFGVTLLHPVYREGLSTEAELCGLGITENPRVKMTARDMQVVCTQQILFAMMMRLILLRVPFSEYERRARAYLGEKLAHLSRLTRDYVERPGEDTRLARLLA